MPAVMVTIPEGSRTALRGAVGGAVRRNTEARQGMTQEAVSNVPAAAEVEEAPPPPPSNPVPEHTEKVLGLSDKRLPDQSAPALAASDVRHVENGVKVGGSLPRIGETPVQADLFQVLITPSALELTAVPEERGPDGKENPEAARMRKALEQLTGTGEATTERQGRGEQVIAKDEGPVPMRPLPEHLQAPVGQVVARLLAQVDETTSGVLDTLREMAYRGGVLKRNFPEAGKDMTEGLKTAVSADLREIAAAANVSGEELDGMIAARQRELATSSQDAAATVQAEGEAAAQKAADEGQRTMDAIDGAAQAAEEETVRRQEATSGTADPAVINRRRDLTVRWIRDHVTTQITAYQQAGDRRTGELQNAQRQQTAAYGALVQREQYQVMTPQHPDRPQRDTTDTARERRLADLAVAIRAWGDERIAALSESFRLLISGTTSTTRKHRGDIESAGSAGIEAARQWAEDKILENESWWDRFIARIRRWLAEADDVNERWRVRRTEQNRNLVAMDFQTVETARAAMAAGLTRDQILADERLSLAERAILEQYFSQAEGMHPLDFAARRLRTNTALEHLDSARETFEAELIATPVSGGDSDTVEKLNQVAQSQGGAFDAARIAQDLRSAMDQIGTDEDLIFSSLRGLTPLRGAVVRKFYRARYDRDLDYDLEDEMSGDELAQAQAQVAGQQARADAIALHDAVAGLGTDEAAIMATLRNKTPEEVEAIKAEYLSRYGETLDEALEDDLDEGNEIDQARALMAGDTATADAIQLDEAMRGGFLGLGTNEADIEQVYTRMRQEVLSRARAERWTSAQFEAEVRRRLAAIEERFGRRYAHVAQYNEPGLEGESVLARAYSSELSGAQLDLANALQGNDLVAADAARLEIERTSFYVSDNKVNDVLRSQYERALEARRLDEGPARNMVVRREVERLRDEGKSEEEISRARMALERRMEREMADGAQVDSRMTMDQLKDVYSNRYHLPVEFVVEWGMSGDDRNRARSMLEQGGRLDPLQEVEYATRDIGTDVDALRRTFSSMTWDEIQALRAEWERRHPGESFDAMLRSELSGRDESDIMDMVQNGAPESAMERIAQERRRVRREIEDLTGVLGGTAAGKEAAWMDHQLAQLRELEGPLNRTDWPDTDEGRRQREELQEQVDFRVTRVQDAVADHRRRLDSFTDAVTQVVGIVIGVTVAVILGAVSGGTLGIATIAVMASIMATASTMVAKQLILGGAYGDEAILTDVAVGAVDALTAAATAGMGSKLLGPMKNLVARTRVGDVASFVAKSGLGQRIAQVPGVGALGRMPGRALPSRAGMERAAASFMAEGLEDAVGAAPSAFVQIALTDETWKGDPLANFLESGGMALLQSVAMGRVMAGTMGVGSHVFTSARGHLRMGSDVGRLLEANRIIQEGFSTFRQDNPGASLTDFLAHPEGRKVRADIETKGLMPTLESVTRAAEAPGVRAETPGGPATRGEVAGEAPAVPPQEARAAELHAMLPEGLKEGSFVTPDPELEGRTVRVEPMRIGKEIVGVDIRIGPDATPLDIALHAGTVHAMQKYRGVLGNIRRVLEDFAAFVTRSGLTVDSRGWEARLELGKLPAIIAARMDELAGRPLTPEIEARVMADIASLQAQFNTHSAILADPDLRGQPGRGYVAAEEKIEFAKLPRHDASGQLTEVGRLELDTEIRNFKVARKGGDYDTMRAALERMEELTGLPRNTIYPLAAMSKADRVEVVKQLQHVRQADPAADADYINGLLDDLVPLTGLRPEKLRVLATAPESVPDLMHLLTGRPVEPETALPSARGQQPVQPSETGEAFIQRKIGELRRPEGAPEIPSPAELINRIGRGDAEAQAMLDRNSAAPSTYTTEAFDVARLEKCLTGDPKKRRTGILKIGNGEIKISRMPVTKDNPNPPFHFYDEFPPYSQVGNKVLQLEDGGLRIWRGLPEEDYPEGRLFQETTVEARRERAGHETRAQESYSKAGLVGPKTERAHAHGPGRGPESPFGILHAPVEVNQALQKRGIEAFFERLRDESPPGLSWHYVTEVRHQGDETRLSDITYRIDVTINGIRMPFAEFAIHIEPLPASMAPGDVTARNIVHVDPITFRSNERPLVQEIFTHLQELADVPRFVQHGLGRGEAVDAAAAAAHLSIFDPDAVRSVVKASRGGMVSLPPGDVANFNAKVWEKRLLAHFESDSWARFVVVDLRGLGLTAKQIRYIETIIFALPQTQAARIVLIR